MAKTAIVSDPQQSDVSRGDDPPYPPLCGAARLTEVGACIKLLTEVGACIKLLTEVGACIKRGACIEWGACVERGGGSGRRDGN
jgi:hypothetical protein